MQVECPRHPGASTIGSQLLDETAPMAGKSWQPSHEPPRRREEGYPSHWYSIYSGKMGKGSGGTIQKLCLNVEWRHNKHKGSTCMWTTEDSWLHRLTNASSKHALAQMYEWAQQNAQECRPLTNALAQVPHRTLLRAWRNVDMHWHVCITILQTLKGTQKN